jgi:mono/diheme cytochrome c family protein
MLKVLKWIGIILGGLIGLIVIALAALYFMGSGKVNAAAEVPDEEFSAEGGDADRGRVLAGAWGCDGCHGANLGGTEFINEPPFGYLPAPNLTSGEGGFAASYTDTDFEHAIRHGVGGDGRKLLIMPSGLLTNMTDVELADLIAYLRSAEAVDNDLGKRAPHPLGLVLFGAGVIPMDELASNGTIDHEAGHAAANPTDDMALGEYRALVCTECHGDNLNGGPLPFDPAAGTVPNLTPAGDLGNWTEEDFVRTIREGVTPEGDSLDPELMPWPKFAALTDEELHALWVYISSLDAIPTGTGEAQ